jgi:hypothetical protein
MRLVWRSMLPARMKVRASNAARSMLLTATWPFST